MRSPLEKIHTLGDFMQVNWIALAKPGYEDRKYWWIRNPYIISQDALDRICELSNGLMINSMGDLYLKKL